MRRLSVVVVAVGMLLGACGDSDSTPAGADHRADVSASPSSSSGSAGTGGTDAVDTSRVAMQEANTLHYTFELIAEDRVLVREEGAVQLQPTAFSFSRVVGAEDSFEAVATAQESWVRTGQTCWTHRTHEGTPSSAPLVDVALYSGLVSSNGRVMRLHASIPRVVSALGEAAIKQLDVPEDGPAGAVDVRATLDDAGRVSGWETTLAEVLSGLEEAGAHPDPSLKKLDAKFVTTFTHVGEPVDVAPPKDNEVCADGSSAP